MELKVEYKSDSAVKIVNENSSIILSVADLKMEEGKDHKLVLAYYSDVSITIPAGYVAVGYQLDKAAGNSLEFAGGNPIFTEGENNITCRFKVNTDSIPSIYDKGDKFIRLCFLKAEKFKVSESEYVKKEENKG